MTMVCLCTMAYRETGANLSLVLVLRRNDEASVAAAEAVTESTQRGHVYFEYEILILGFVFFFKCF